MHYITITRNFNSGKKYLAYNVYSNDAKESEYETVYEIFGSGALINEYFLIDLYQTRG